VLNLHTNSHHTDEVIVNTRPDSLADQTPHRPRSSASPIRLKAIALPPEHGAWGFLLEPILLGLGVVPSWGGLLIALAALGAFLIRQPIKIVYGDRRKGRIYARTRIAERIALLYGIWAVAALVGAVLSAHPGILIPLALAAPVAVIQFRAYLLNRGRGVLPELAGAAALAVTAPGIALAGEASPGAAFVLWLIVIARNVPSILYIRAHLRLEHDKPYTLTPVAVSNLVAVTGMLLLAALDRVPMLVIAALTLLFFRAMVGLSPYRRRVRIQTIGFLEMAYGLIVVLAAVMGYGMDL
jgi:hypothetical protein